jgi:hypothetical protein
VPSDQKDAPKQHFQRVELSSLEFIISIGFECKEILIFIGTFFFTGKIKTLAMVVARLICKFHAQKQKSDAAARTNLR